jgi:tetratricopeptide (TPR) repeat protein
MRLPALTLAILLGSLRIFCAEGFGHVTFPNSGAPTAQADFLAGMALLHDFEYPAAIAAFRRAEAADPGFAMAYWGEAMAYTHPVWMEQDLERGRAALNRLAPTAGARRAKAGTEREQAYLDAIEVLYGEGTKTERDLRFASAMGQVRARYPDDVDATAFYGLAILGTAHAGREVATYMRAAGVLEEAWLTHQEHPGLLHYLIHCYDDPTHAPLGLRAARIYARVAPDAGHAQHMTAHIFLALGMWRETVEANLAGIAAMHRMRGMSESSGSGCGHYATWLAYAHLQLGEHDEARTGLESCGATARSNPDARPETSMDPDNSRAGSFANMRLRYLIDSADWSGDAARAPLPINAGAGARLDFAFGDALRAIGLRDLAASRRARDQVESVAKEVVDLETRRADPDPTYRVRPEILMLQVRGLIAELSGNVQSAATVLAEAVSGEDALPVAFGPPTIDKPSHELLGEFLLRHGKADEARVEFERALARTPGRRLATQGLAAAR